jgi:hypothetical protein
MKHKSSSAILGFDYILSLPGVGGDWVNVDRVIDRKTARKLRQLAAQTGASVVSRLIQIRVTAPSFEEIQAAYQANSPYARERRPLLLQG